MDDRRRPGTAFKGSPLPLAERRKRQSELGAQLDALEREEEALIEAAMAVGTYVALRTDANPLANDHWS
jgi:hypothetical protein